MTGCSLTVRIGPPIITQVTVGGCVTETPGPTFVPFPEGAWFTVGALCTIFGITRNHMYVLLHLHKKKLGPPVYREKGSVKPRRRHRIVSEQDYQYLRTLFPVRIGLSRRTRR